LPPVAQIQRPSEGGLSARDGAIGRGKAEGATGRTGAIESDSKSQFDYFLKWFGSSPILDCCSFSLQGGVMSKVRLIALNAFFVAFGTLTAVPAKADLVFNLNVACSTCGGLSSYGTITASNDGTNLKIVEQLASGVFFNNASAPNYALEWDLDKTGTNNPPSSIIYSTAPYAQLNGGADNTSVVTGLTAAGTYSAPPFTSGKNPNFEFAVTFNDATINGNKAAAQYNMLTFEIKNMQLSNLESDLACNTTSCVPSSNTPIFFVSDIWNTNPGGNTGYVGGTLEIGGPGLTTGVPEPSTWAMMIVGFMGLGFLAYRKKNSIPRFA
jgi:hypothetical protein